MIFRFVIEDGSGGFVRLVVGVVWELLLLEMKVGRFFGGKTMNVKSK